MAGDGWRPIHSPGGVPVQQGVTVDPEQYSHFRAMRPLLCIIWEVFPADHDRNITAQKSLARRGSMTTCSVIVVNDGQPCCYFLDNVVIPPEQASGLDDFYENPPRPSTQLVTGEALNAKLSGIDPYTLDGDWCVVMFLGGNQDMPFVMSWWPNPKNTYDPATSGKGNPDRNGRGRALIQEGRYFRRLNGVENVVTSRGDVYLSTRLANSELRMNETSEDGRWPRTTDEEDGGSIHVEVKPTQMVELTWRTQPHGIGVGQGNDDELPQPNPRPTSGNRETEDTENTYVFLDKQTARVDTDTVRVKVASLISLTSDDRITVSVENDIDVSCDSATIGVDTELNLGGTGGNTLIDSRWKTAWDTATSVVPNPLTMPTGSPAQNAAAIAALQTLIGALYTALGSSLTEKTKAV